MERQRAAGAERRLAVALAERNLAVSVVHLLLGIEEVVRTFACQLGAVAAFQLVVSLLLTVEHQYLTAVLEVVEQVAATAEATHETAFRIKHPFFGFQDVHRFHVIRQYIRLREVGVCFVEDVLASRHHIELRTTEGTFGQQAFLHQLAIHLNRFGHQLLGLFQTDVQAFEPNLGGTGTVVLHQLVGLVVEGVNGIHIVRAIHLVVQAAELVLVVGSYLVAIHHDFPVALLQGGSLVAILLQALLHPHRAHAVLLRQCLFLLADVSQHSQSLHIHTAHHILLNGYRLLTEFLHTGTVGIGQRSLLLLLFQSRHFLFNFVQSGFVLLALAFEILRNHIRDAFFAQSAQHALLDFLFDACSIGFGAVRVFQAFHILHADAPRLRQVLVELVAEGEHLFVATRPLLVQFLHTHTDGGEAVVVRLTLGVVGVHDLLYRRQGGQFVEQLLHGGCRAWRDLSVPHEGRLAEFGHTVGSRGLLSRILFVDYRFGLWFFFDSHYLVHRLFRLLFQFLQEALGVSVGGCCRQHQDGGEDS